MRMLSVWLLKSLRKADGNVDMFTLLSIRTCYRYKDIVFTSNFMLCITYFNSLRTTCVCAKVLHGWLHVAGKTFCVILFKTFIKPYIFCPYSLTCKHLHKSSLDFSIGFEFFEAFTFLRPKVMKDCSWPVSFLTSGKLISSN